MKTVNLTQRSPEWHDWRRKGIGGSDVPIILGISPYKKSIRDLYHEKRGNPMETETNEFAITMGDKAEKFARAKILELYGEEMTPACVELECDPRFIASLDGVISNAIVEVKYVGREVLNTALNNGLIPNHHYCQIQHQLMVSGMSECLWFGVDPDGNHQILTIGVDKESIDSIYSKSLEFLIRVEKGVPPDIHAHEWLELIDSPLLAELARARQEMNTANTRFDELKIKVIETYPHDKVRGHGLMVFKSERKGSIDYKKIPAVKALSKADLEPYRGEGSTSWTVKLEKENE